MCVSVCVMSMWRAEDNFMELVLLPLLCGFWVSEVARFVRQVSLPIEPSGCPQLLLVVN